jgi:hypothetical protein
MRCSEPGHRALVAIPSPRTLLIATTLAAVMLGLIVWLW